MRTSDDFPLSLLPGESHLVIGSVGISPIWTELRASVLAQAGCVLSRGVHTP
jgi:hypothetical protein